MGRLRGRRLAALGVTAGLAAGLLAGCGAPESSSATPVTAAAPAGGDPNAPPGGSTGARSDRGPQPRRVARLAASGAADRGGGLVLAYAPTQDETFAGYEEIFREHQLFEDALGELNELIVFPQDVTVRLGECGEANAFYDGDGTILMCYELLSYFTEIFAADMQAQTDEEWEEVGGKAVAAFFFVFYHELGHALVHVLDLPITGREEDAVDQLATVMLLESWDGEDSELAILSSAEWFGIDASAEHAELDMADEHSLDEQRYYNLVCWIYGSDTDYFSEVASDWELPEERAERCEGEYLQMSGAWDRLLGPHLAADG